MLRLARDDLLLHSAEDGVVRGRIAHDPLRAIRPAVKANERDLLKRKSDQPSSYRTGRQIDLTGPKLDMMEMP